MQNDRGAVWRPLSEALADIAKNSPVKECCARDLIWQGIHAGRVRLRGRPLPVDPTDAELLLIRRKRSTTELETPPKSHWSSFRPHEDAGYWFGQNCLFVTSSDGASTVWADCALLASDLKAFLAAEIFWREESDFGRPRKEIEWKEFLQTVLELERLHLLNAVSCKGSKMLKGWIMQIMHRPLSERSLDPHIDMLWVKFVSNHRDPHAARWRDVERLLEDQAEALARGASDVTP